MDGKNKGHENLIPMNKRSKEEAREAGRKGGINSGKTRRAKADMRELMKMMLQEDVPGAEMTYAQSLTKSMLTIAKTPKQGAAAVRAYETILHIIGQDNPEQGQEALDKLDKILREVRSNAFESETE